MRTFALIVAFNMLGCAAYCESVERAAKQRMLEDYCIDEAETRPEAEQCINAVRDKLEKEYTND